MRYGPFNHGLQVLQIVRNRNVMLPLSQLAIEPLLIMRRRPNLYDASAKKQRLKEARPGIGVSINVEEIFVFDLA